MYLANVKSMSVFTYYGDMLIAYELRIPPIRYNDCSAVDLITKYLAMAAFSNTFTSFATPRQKQKRWNNSRRMNF